MLSHSALKSLIPALYRQRIFVNSAEILSIKSQSFQNPSNQIYNIHHVRSFTSSRISNNQLNTSNGNLDSHKELFNSDLISHSKSTTHTQRKFGNDFDYDEEDNKTYTASSFGKYTKPNHPYNRDDNFSSNAHGSSGFNNRSNSTNELWNNRFNHRSKSMKNSYNNRSSNSSYRNRKIEDDSSLPELGDDAAVDPNFTAKQVADANPENEKLNVDKFDISHSIKSFLKQEFGIKQFYPIQAECYEPIVSGKDVLGRSRTGTGKTLAFVLPLVERLMRSKTRREPSCASILIIEPTRELANQVANEIRKLVPHLKAVAVYGGVPMMPQYNLLRTGVDFLIGTPGRTLDHLKRGSLCLDKCMSVVLDEADELLRMGFKQDVDTILSYTAPKTSRQTLLFSATLPSWVESIAKEEQNNPTVIDKVSGEENTTPSTIKHQAILTGSDFFTKLKILTDLIKETTGRVIVFSNTKTECEILLDRIWTSERIPGRVLHGDVSQARRDAIMQQFKDGKVRLLICSDVAARGIDIPNVQMVVQFGLPRQLEFYVHRSGRTGRAGREGRCVVICPSEEKKNLLGLVRDAGVNFEFLPTTDRRGNKMSILSGSSEHTTLHFTGDEYTNQSSVRNSLTNLSGKVLTIAEFVSLNRHEDLPPGSLVDIDTTQVGIILENASKSSIPVKECTSVSTIQFSRSSIGHFIGMNNNRRGGMNNNRRDGGQRNGNFQRRRSRFDEDLNDNWKSSRMSTKKWMYEKW